MNRSQGPLGKSVRAANLEVLRQAGFVVAQSLPTSRGGSVALRPAPEIARRLMALDAVFTWTCFPEEAAPALRVEGYIHRNELRGAMTDKERAIVDLPRVRAHEKHVGTVGWKLENMWPLAWVLGFPERPAFDGAMIDETIQSAMIMEFLPGLGASVDDVLEKGAARSYEEVDGLEDLFYCAHNAARGAQLGGDTVPEGFDPVTNGGVIHERRHALTWCLSPGVAWSDTDLST
jgi:hypothetical protein